MMGRFFSRKDNTLWQPAAENGEPLPTPSCCSAWKDFRHNFKWYTIENHPTHMVMPSILGSAGYWRVNYCPSCGKEVRGSVWVWSAK